MNNNVLSYAEYQKRIREMKTPEDIAAFAQELIAPVLAGKTSEPDEPKVEEKKTPAAATTGVPQKRALLPKEKMYAVRKLQLADANVISPKQSFWLCSSHMAGLVRLGSYLFQPE